MSYKVCSKKLYKLSLRFVHVCSGKASFKVIHEYMVAERKQVSISVKVEYQTNLKKGRLKEEKKKVKEIIL